MYGFGPDYLGNLPIFEAQVDKGQTIPNDDGPLNYGYWRRIDWVEGKITPVQRRLASDDLIRLVARELAVKEGDEILEIGHGTGYGARLVLQEYNPAKIHAIDQSADQVSRAERTTVRPDQRKRISFHQGVAEQLEFFDSKFNGIYSVEAAQHFTSFTNFAAESFRTLTPGGKISLCAFWMSKLDGREELKKLLPTIETGVDNPIYIVEALKYLRNAGFGQVIAQAIGDAVWHPLVAYCEQVLPSQQWSRNWIKSYEDGLIDYYLVTGQK